MKRFFYTLLALAISSGTPLPDIADDFSVDTGEDPPDVTISSPDRRGRPAGWPEWAGLPNVVVTPASLFDGGDHQGVAGSIQVEHSDLHVSDVRSLQALETPWRDVIAARLLEAALADCVNDGALKVRIEMPLPLQHIATVCRNSRFNYWRTVRRGQRRIHEFYSDLYTAPEEDRAEGRPA